MLSIKNNRLDLKKTFQSCLAEIEEDANRKRETYELYYNPVTGAYYEDDLWGDYYYSDGGDFSPGDVVYSDNEHDDYDDGSTTIYYYTNLNDSEFTVFYSLEAFDKYVTREHIDVPASAITTIANASTIYCCLDPVALYVYKKKELVADTSFDSLRWACEDLMSAYNEYELANTKE